MKKLALVLAIATVSFGSLASDPVFDIGLSTNVDGVGTHPMIFERDIEPICGAMLVGDEYGTLALKGEDFNSDSVQYKVFDNTSANGKVSIEINKVNLPGQWVDKFLAAGGTTTDLANALEIKIQGAGADQQSNYVDIKKIPFDVESGEVMTFQTRLNISPENLAGGEKATMSPRLLVNCYSIQP